METMLSKRECLSVLTDTSILWNNREILPQFVRPNTKTIWSLGDTTSICWSIHTLKQYGNTNSICSSTHWNNCRKSTSIYFLRHRNICWKIYFNLFLSTVKHLRGNLPQFVSKDSETFARKSTSIYLLGQWNIEKVYLNLLLRTVKNICEKAYLNVLVRTVKHLRETVPESAC